MVKSRSVCPHSMPVQSSRRPAQAMHSTAVSPWLFRKDWTSWPQRDSAAQWRAFPSRATERRRRCRRDPRSTRCCGGNHVRAGHIRRRAADDDSQHDLLGLIRQHVQADEELSVRAVLLGLRGRDFSDLARAGIHDGQRGRRLDNIPGQHCERAADRRNRDRRIGDRLSDLHRYRARRRCGPQLCAAAEGKRRPACGRRGDGGARGHSDRHGVRPTARREPECLAERSGDLHHLRAADGNFAPFVTRAMTASRPLTPYTVAVFFTLGAVICCFFFNIYLMRKPLVGAPVGFSGYASAPASYHALGLLGGAVWGIGTVFNFVAASLVGVAISYAIGQASPMIAALWGVFVWREFRGSNTIAKLYLVGMFLSYILALVLIARAYQAA